MRRIYHHYKDWEDFKAGMYRTPHHYDIEVGRSHDLLADAGALLGAMRGVTQHWRVSCEQQLTDLSQNRRSWLGQAACCYNHQATEQATRDAWWTLTIAEQAAANAAADVVIQEWEERQRGVIPLWDWRGNVRQRRGYHHA